MCMICSCAAAGHLLYMYMSMLQMIKLEPTFVAHAGMCAFFRLGAYHRLRNRRWEFPQRCFFFPSTLLALNFLSQSSEESAG